ncbi:F-box/kelch-repeat protein At3g06240-like [Lotus japonicus]|uniref:F-box/kelch-repeat protein At3g06240-like n=1 Tax=Lotus japonicus TaxID=34305 RepID=UPI00258610E8|nr:F-box/kelch-repeat protein At3g06240-like [Lotus japonicus]
MSNRDEFKAQNSQFNLTKVVVVHWDCTEQKIMARIYCINNICCKKILCDPCSPLMLYQILGEFVGGCVNWLALKNMNGPEYQWDNVTLEQLVIASLDMSTEEYTYMLLPEGVTEVPHFEPVLGVLGNHMCLFHDHNRTHFVVWKMREYGVRESWTRWMSISYENLRCEGFLYRPVPMFLSEDGNILLLALNEDLEFIKYNIRDDNIEYISNPNEEIWLEAIGYVQSLVFPCQD